MSTSKVSISNGGRGAEGTCWSTEVCHSPNEIRRVSACGEGGPAQVARARAGEEGILMEKQPSMQCQSLSGCKGYLVGERVKSIKNC